MAMTWNGELVTRTVKARSAKASQKIAELILAKSQQFVPVDTGELKRSGAIRAGGDAFDADDLSTYRTVVYTAPHAVYVHDGTASMVGRPFLAQAVLFARAEAGIILRTYLGWK